eukprot:7964375-Heterocapsa_arctica.AAC.1
MALTAHTGASPGRRAAMAEHRAALAAHTAAPPSQRPRLAAPPVLGPLDALWAEAEAGLDFNESDSSS